MLVKLITQPHRKQTGTLLEEAVLRNDVYTISSILNQTQRVPMYLLEFAVASGSIDAFEHLLGLLPLTERTQLITQTKLTHGALMNKQFMMFTHLVYNLKCHFKLKSLVDGYNNGVDMALHFLLSICYQVEPVGWFNPIKFTVASGDDQCFTINATKLTQSLNVLDTTVYYETSGKLRSDLSELQSKVFNQMVHVITVLNVESLKYILEHPKCPTDWHQSFLYDSSTANDLVCTSVPMLRYLHNKYNLLDMFSPPNIQQHCSPDSLFYTAIQHGAYDCCDELMRIGIQPTPACWEGVGWARDGVNRLQAYEYLYAIGVPFYALEAEATFDNIFPYVDACSTFVVTGDRSELDFFERIKFPICAQSSELLDRPLTEFISDIHSHLFEQDGIVKRYISCDAVDDAVDIDDHQELNRSLTTKDLKWYCCDSQVQARMIECIRLLLGFGCKWTNVKLGVEGVTNVFVLSCLAPFRTFSPELVYEYVINNHSYSLDLALYCFVNFSYLLPDHKLQRALDKIDSIVGYDYHPEEEIPTGGVREPDSRYKPTLMYWYNDLKFREFALEIRSPLCMYVSGNHQRQFSSTMLKHFQKHCQKIAAQCDEVCKVFQLSGALTDDVVSTVLCAYL